MIKITVKCVECGTKKEYSGTDQPICNKCGGVMIAIKASNTKKVTK